MQSNNSQQTQYPTRVAIISTGVQCSVMDQASSGYTMSLKNGKVHCVSSLQDSVGRGTDLALCLVESVPETEIIGIDIFAGQQRTNSTLLLSALKKALTLNVDVIVCCVQSFNTDKKGLFESICDKAKNQRVTLISCGSEGRLSYPGSLAGCVGVTSHVDCLEFMYFNDPEICTEDVNSRGLFVSNGWWQGRFWGAEMATIRIASHVVEMRRAGVQIEDIEERLRLQSHLPIPPFGYS